MAQQFQYQDMRLFPVLCFSCRTVIGNKQQMYEKLIAEGNTPKQALDKLSIKRTCCRGNILNPPEIPLGLQIDAQTEDIARLYNSFRIDEKSNRTNVANVDTTDISLPVNQINVDFVNTSGDSSFNPTPLAPDQPKPRRIYELSRKGKAKPVYTYGGEIRKIDDFGEMDSKNDYT